MSLTHQGQRSSGSWLPADSGTHCAVQMLRNTHRMCVEHSCLADQSERGLLETVRRAHVGSAWVHAYLIEAIGKPTERLAELTCRQQTRPNTTRTIARLMCVQVKQPACSPSDASCSGRCIAFGRLVNRSGCVCTGLVGCVQLARTERQLRLAHDGASVMNTKQDMDS